MSKLIIILTFVFLFSCTTSTKNDNPYGVDTVSYSNFNIIYNQTDYFSSLDSIYSRYFMNGTRTIKVTLTVDERRIIYEKFKEVDFMNLPDTLTRGDDDCILPCFPSTITIFVGKSKKTVYDSDFCNIKDLEIKNRFQLIEKTIKDIIFNKSEVKKLPYSDIEYL